MTFVLPECLQGQPAPRKKKAKKRAEKKVTKKVTKKKAARGKALPTAWGRKPSGIRWTDRGGSDDCSGTRWGGQKAKAKEWQEELWADGKIPNRPPRGWKVRKLIPEVSPDPVCMSRQKANKEIRRWRGLSDTQKAAQKKAGKKPCPQEIPVSKYGDPNLAWFVDPRVAGDKAGKILVMFSGGKDSLAILLYVCEILAHEYGLDYRDHVECWHQCVDGRPSVVKGGKPSVSGGSFRQAKWDWPITEDYCMAVCEALEIPLYFGWREGGLTKRTLREDEVLGSACYELPWLRAGAFSLSKSCTEGTGGPRTAWSLPAQSADLKTRWCSSFAKIEAAERQMRARMDRDLKGRRILYVSGERAEESANRAQYQEREFYAYWNPKADKGRGGWSGLHGTERCHVEKWKPVHRWCELDVWAIIRRWKIRPHPAYIAGWGRLSCMTCIFGSRDQWASIAAIDPKRADQWARLEEALIVRREEDMELGDEEAKTRIVQVNENRTWLRKTVISKVRIAGVPGTAEELGVDLKKVDGFRRSKAPEFRPTGDSRRVVEELLFEHGVPALCKREGIYQEDLESFLASKAKEFEIDRSIPALVDHGTPFESLDTTEGKAAWKAGLRTKYTDDVIMRSWRFQTPSGAPAGAFGEDFGPT